MMPLTLMDLHRKAGIQSAVVNDVGPNTEMTGRMIYVSTKSTS
jgi:hypothetical protein